MKFFCIGINHKTAPVELRERVNITHEALAEGYQTADWLSGIAMVSTCNRIELYASTADDARLEDMTSLWGKICDVDAAEFSPSLYQWSDHSAVSHLLRVSAGLESMVLGEPQILGQVIRANETAIANQTADALLKSVFQFAIRSGKRARTETRISRNPVSVSSIGVSLVKQHVTNIETDRVLVIGAGEMAQLAVKGLKSYGFKQITIVNRSKEKAEALAQRWGIEAEALADLKRILPEADALVTATSAPTPILNVADVADLTKPITMVDLAVPRDIDPACATSSWVQLYDVDALKHVVAEGLAERQKEVPFVEAILDEEKARFQAWEKESAVLPTLTAIRQQAEQIRQKELSRTLKYLGDVDPDMLKHIDKLSQTLVKQLLHRPTKALRDEARNGTLNGLDDSAKKLFDL